MFHVMFLLLTKKNRLEELLDLNTFYFGSKNAKESIFDVCISDFYTGSLDQQHQYHRELDRNAGFQAPLNLRNQNVTEGVWLYVLLSSSGVFGECKLYDPVILVLATVRFPMSKTEFNHFVYIYSVNPWQPASNLQRADAIKRYSFILGERLDLHL